MQVLFPVLGGSPESRAAAIEESKERQWQWHSDDATSHWFYVEDEQSGEVVGGAQWHVHEKNPFEGPQKKLEAYWWPEGECKRFMDEMLEQVYGPRQVKMTRPHTCKFEWGVSSRVSDSLFSIYLLHRFANRGNTEQVCNLMFVHPAHRRRGAGRLLMGWGVEKAQEKGFEVFVESTDLGRPLYESFGLAVTSVFQLGIYEANMSDEWRKLEREILPMHFYFMWKPAGGVYEKGKTVVPWEKVN